jgi:hypothetical protein
MSISLITDAKTTLLVAVINGNRVLGVSLLRFNSAGSCGPLQKQLGYQAVMAYPERAGQRWNAALDVVPAAGGHRPMIRFEVWSCDPHPVRLAEHYVPIDNFSHHGVALARQLGITHPYTVCVTVLDPQHALNKENDLDDEDFALCEQPELTLPHNFSTAPLGPTRVVRQADPAWLRCVFQIDAYRTFLEAARFPLENERGWVAEVQVRICQGVISVVIENLFEVPFVSASRYHIKTSGSQFYKLRQEHPQLGAYLHLHPRDVLDENGRRAALCPLPSGPDTVLAWDLDASSEFPVVCPIALSEFRRDHESEDIAVSAFMDNLFHPINLEVLL